MTPKLSNLDIPEIIDAAAEWALVSSQIEKITLHRFKPSKLRNPNGPFYSIIIWVSPEIDVNIVPWMKLLEDQSKEGKLLRKQLIKRGRKHPKYNMFHKFREQVKGQVRKQPLYGLWNLFWELSAIESKARECFYSFYREGFERSDHRFDWLVLLLNIGDEHVFNSGEIHDDLDNTEVGSAVLFSRKNEALLENAKTTQSPISDGQMNMTDDNPMLKPRVAIILDEATKLRRSNPTINKVMAKRVIDAILLKHGYSPYGRTQFNRIIKDLDFPLAPRGRKPAKH